MQKIRMGMVGGGQGAFIGAVHRMAANLDGQIELVCGAFSSTAERSKQSGRALFLDDSRCYSSYQEMFEVESKLPADKRMQLVAIVTPNHLHFPVAKMAIEHGFHVMSDKPATFTLEEALALEEILNAHDVLYGLTHTYTGYPMVKEAKALINAGKIGKVRKIVVEYPQGWLAEAPDQSNKQAIWRLDPKQAGISCCMGDIGVHAANLAEYMSSLEITELCADLVATVENRELDDDGTVLLKFNNGARGVLMASQISVGEENNLKIRVYGETGGLEWSQQEPNSLILKDLHEPNQILRAGIGQQSEFATANMRTPAGHPEGYLEAFANIYRNFAQQIRAFEEKQTPDEIAQDVPGIKEAVRGMAFIENVVAASQSNEKWHAFSIAPNNK
ncbi:Gfo/Idh/MocA family protein [Catenovulum sediminis]|uniref:Gfo/Idh/MocA family protein n=1 Tax=Catenovulum sediminis TaxID=1740262 RepID=UPI001C8F5DC1|nr:Gfo/Idh/MocA family oxidoreductase [Catenovulum sediminis]